MMDQFQMVNRSYVAWPPPPLHEDPSYFLRPNFSSTNPKRTNWKPQNSTEMRRNDPLGIGYIYQFSNQYGFQSQNRLKSRRFYPKKKFGNRFAPFAPRNTTSFIIRAKKSGGIASLVSPCPVTPAILPTPILSPSSEALMDTAKEEWGVDGYGSMKGLIRLRSLTNGGEDEEEGGGGTSDSDLEEHVEVERRLDHDLSRFEMIYPNDEQTNLLENRFHDQDTHITRLEEENLTLKERIFLMQIELEDLRRRVQCLETNGEALGNEEVGDVCSEKTVGDAE